jgi:hypothetical protein
MFSSFREWDYGGLKAELNDQLTSAIFYTYSILAILLIPSLITRSLTSAMDRFPLLPSICPIPEG